MSNPMQLATKVEAAIKSLNSVEGNVVSFEEAEGGVEVTVHCSAVEGDDEATNDDASPSNSSAVEGEDDEAGSESSPSNSSAVEGDDDDDDDDTSDSSNSSAVEGESEQKYPDLIETEEGFRCPLCEDYEGSKGEVNGHKGHCDSPSNSSAVEEESDTEENDTSPSNSSAVEEGKCGEPCSDGSPCQISAPCHIHNSSAVEGKEEADNDASSSNSSAVDEEEAEGMTKDDLLNNGVKEKNVDTAFNLRKKNGECRKADCIYGANHDSKFCASHQNSSAVKKGSTDKKFENLTEAQKTAMTNLLEEKADDDSFGAEEAIQMV